MPGSVSETLRIMANQVDDAIYKGEYWLSTDTPSSHWIWLDQLDNEAFKKRLEEVFETLFKQFAEKRRGENFTVVFCSKLFTEITELDLSSSLEKAISPLKDQMVFMPVGLDREAMHLYGSEAAQKNLPNTKCILVLALSLHLDLINRLIEEFAQRGSHVDTVVTVIEREGISRMTLAQKRTGPKGAETTGIDLIPALVWTQNDNDLSVVSVLEHKGELYEKYAGYFVDQRPWELSRLLAEHPPQQQQALQQKLPRIREHLKDNDALYTKAERIIRGIEALLELQSGKLTRSNARNVYKWVNEELTRPDFKEMAKVGFALWATPDNIERLRSDAVEHIRLANERMGSAIAAGYPEFQSRRPVKILDLGSGMLGTIRGVVRALREAKLTAEFDAVEFTPEILKHARLELPKLVSDDYEIRLKNQDVAQYVADKVKDPDYTPEYHYVTLSYTIHHLHYEEQDELVSGIFKLLKPNGRLFIADPQEGISNFNLDKLMPKEPEGVFAAFSTPQEVIARMQKAGFVDTSILLDDPEEYTGFLVTGCKPTTTSG